MLNWFKKKPPLNPDAPAFWKTYLETVQASSYHKKEAIDNIGFVVFDTETTGLDVQEDQILSIGAIRVKNWQIEVSDR